ncbi:MAG: FAD-dependent monooxygenase [Pseudomonadota bacterium]
MTRDTSDFDIAIAGSGLVGLTLALAVAKAAPSLRIVVIDPALPQPQADDTPVGLRVSALTPGSIENFKALDVWSAMPHTHYQPYTTMRVWDAGVDCGEGVCFDAAAMGVAHLGSITDNVMLRESLWQRCMASSGISSVEQAVAGIQVSSRHVSIELSDGATINASLLVGADGRASRIRDFMGVDTIGWSHDQQALVAHLLPDTDHDGCALQRFLPDGPLALLPLPDKRVSLVLSTTPDECARLQALEDARFEDALTEASDAVLGRLRLDSARASFALESRYAREPIAQRCALVGDAAHAVHPLAGQGANLGFADVAVLATVIDDALRAGQDIGDAPVLRRYRRARSADNLTTVYGLDLINRLFARGDGTFAEARRRGMRWFDRIGVAKHLAAGHAMRGGRLPRGARE